MPCKSLYLYCVIDACWYSNVLQSTAVGHTTLSIRLVSHATLASKKKFITNFVLLEIELSRLKNEQTML